MTEHLTPNERDELASAYLDGQANADGVTHVEGDPGLMAVVDELADVREFLSDAPQAKPAVRAEHLANALAAFDEVHQGLPETAPSIASVTSEESGPSATVTSIFGRRRRAEHDNDRASSRRNGVPAWLSAAAASVAVLGGVAAYRNFQGDTDSSFDSASADIAESDESSDGSGSFSVQAGQAEMMADGDFAGADERVDEDALMESAAVPADAPQGSSATSQAIAEDSAESGALGGNTDDGSADDAEESLEEEASDHVEPLPYPAGTTADVILAEIGVYQTDLANSVCSLSPDLTLEPAIDPPGDVIGFYAVDLAGQDAELLIYGPAVAFLVDPTTCQTIES